MDATSQRMWSSQLGRVRTQYILAHLTSLCELTKQDLKATIQPINLCKIIKNIIKERNTRRNFFLCNEVLFSYYLFLV